MRHLVIPVALALPFTWSASARAATPLDPIGLPTTAAAGALIGGLSGSAAAIGVAYAAEQTTRDEVTPENRALNQLATFGTLSVPALLSVAGAVVGGGASGDLIGALTAGFGATVGAAVGTGLALVVVPLAPNVDGTGGGLPATAAVSGLVVGGALLGTAASSLIAALTVDPVAAEEASLDEQLNRHLDDLDPDAPLAPIDAPIDVPTDAPIDAATDAPIDVDTGPADPAAVDGADASERE